jgi:poly(3-hydroxyalkanoate) depolymerase
VSALSRDDGPLIRFVDVDGVRLRTSVRGAGRPLLVLTGIGAALELSAPIERALNAHGVQTIALDAPGTGESSQYARPRRMSGVAHTVEEALGALGYDRVDVLGVSFGGILAQQLAHQAPDRVRRLVLAATAAGVPLLGGVPGSPRALLALATPRRYQSPDYYRRIAGTLYGGQARRDPNALLHGSIARFSEAPSLRGYLGQLYAISFWTGVPWLWRLPQSTLVLAGDDDPIVPVINGRILARIIPRARLEIIRGGGHLFLLERPTELANLVARFLTARDAGAPARPADQAQGTTLFRLAERLGTRRHSCRPPSAAFPPPVLQVP